MSKHSGYTRGLSLPGDQVPQVGELVAGKYRIEGRLGAGGMGMVLAARHEAIGQRVAIKFLVIGDEDFRQEAIQRLLREARAAAALRGEHVVRVYDVGELPDGAPFIVMEHLEGRDLAEVMSSAGRLPVSEAATLVAQAASAVAEAHRAGIVHRDLKPSNLFVVRRPDGSAAIKVLDFGIAKSADPVQPQTLTGARAVLGTAHYMSPEQIRDSHAVDARSDVWSLGAILYELVAGRPAFQAATHSGVYAAIVTDTPPPLSSLRPDAPVALEQLLGRCLERDPAKRVQSAEQLAELLAPFALRSVEFDQLLERSSPAPLLDERVVAADLDGGALAPTLPLASSGDAAAAPDTQLSFGASSAASSANRRDAAVVSGLQRTQRSSSGEAAARSPLLRRALLASSSLAVFALLLFFLLRSSVEPAKIEPTAVLTIESHPSGALVHEGALLLGATPLQLPLSVASGAPQRRVFLLRLPGYRPYVLEQGPAAGTVLARVELTPEPASPPASSAPSAEPSATAAPPPARHSHAPARAGQRVAPSASAEPGPEIRLNR